MNTAISMSTKILFMKSGVIMQLNLIDYFISTKFLNSFGLLDYIRADDAK